MSDDPMTILRAAYVAERARAFARSTRGIVTPEQRQVWHDEACKLIAQHDARVKAQALRDAADDLGPFGTCIDAIGYALGIEVRKGRPS